jgi:hypothetical protein
LGSVCWAAACCRRCRDGYVVDGGVRIERLDAVTDNLWGVIACVNLPLDENHGVLDKECPGLLIGAWEDDQFDGSREVLELHGGHRVTLLGGDRTDRRDGTGDGDHLTNHFGTDGCDGAGTGSAQGGGA